MKRSHYALLLVPSLVCFSSSSFAQNKTAVPPQPPSDEPSPSAAPPRQPPPNDPTPLAVVNNGPGTGAVVVPASNGPLVSLTTLRILRDKGIVTQAEFDSAVRDMTESIGQKGAGEANTIVLGKWATTLYGFVEADSIYDTTQSFNDLAGNGQVARAGTYAGNNHRVQFGARNSRIGFRMKAPEVGGIRTSAMLEMDFLGNQLPIGPNNAAPTGTAPTANGATGNGTATEAQYFTNPGFRVRHMNLKIETPVVDLMFGQYWQLYGWQQVYAPNTVEIQGLPGQIYSRTPQVRISKSVKSDSFIFEIAIAAMRPPQRDSAVPEGQAGIRIGTPAWSGLTTGGSTGTSIQPLSIAVTGDARSFNVPPYTNTSTPIVLGSPRSSARRSRSDGFLPIIPAKKRQGERALGDRRVLDRLRKRRPLHRPIRGRPGAELHDHGQGHDDHGIRRRRVDPGLVIYRAQQRGGHPPRPVAQSWIFGLQYYLPGLDGKVWLSGNISNISSNNLQNGFVTPGATFNPKSVRMSEAMWAIGNIFWDATDAVRLGFEAAMFDDEYVDRTHAQNLRLQFSAWYLF